MIDVELIDIKKRDTLDEILKVIRMMDEKEILVGVFGDKMYDGDELTVVGKAIVNEYGAQIQVSEKMRAYLHYHGMHLKDSTEVINIPERSFVRGSFDSNKEQIYFSIDNMIVDVISGKLTADQMFGIIGENSVKMMKKYIKNFIPPPNAPYTLERKQGTTPLIDTGELYRSIDWKVVDKRIKD